jgi:hypothetical protein
MNIINVHSVENFLLIKTFQIELENSSLICERQRALKQANKMTFITHRFRVSVVSDLRERVRDFRITFALYVKKIFIN